MSLLIDAETCIGPHRCAARMQFGGPAKVWMARIDGTDPRWGLRRSFLRKDLSGVSASGRRGAAFFYPDGPGLYEYAGFAFAGAPSRGFAEILPDGRVRMVSESEARRIAGGVPARAA